MSHLRRVVPPAVEPVSLEEAKAHMRISADFVADDAMIGRLIVAARERCEATLDRALVTSTWEYTVDAWPCRGGPTFGLPMPVASIESVSYFNAAGTLQTLGPSAYRLLSGEPGRLEPAYGTSWPLARGQSDAITVRFVAGYGDPEDVPELLKLGILMLAAHWYIHPEAAAEPSVGAGVSEMPLGVSYLWTTERWR